MASNPDVLLVYPHTARTGGVTLRKRVLAHVFGEHHVYNRHYVPDALRWRLLTDKELEGYRAYTELDYCREIGLRRPTLYIASLRHPVYRIVSLYGFIRRLNTHRHHELANSVPIDEFYRRASEITPKYFRDAQCRRICGRADVKRATDVIRAKYVGVGLTNHLTDFVLALCPIFGWPTIDLGRKPPDSERYDALISPAFQEMVLAENPHDLALFDAISNGLAQEPKKGSASQNSLGASMSRFAASLRTRISRLTMARSRWTRRAASKPGRKDAPNTRTCNICGTTQDVSKQKAKRICPSCNASDRERSFPVLFDSVLLPLLGKIERRDALLLSPAGIERKLLTPKFENVTTSSLFNTYKGNFVKADIRDLAPFSDASFDFAQACNVLDYVPEIESALRAVNRVLRPGGVFSFHIVDGRVLPGNSDIAVTFRKDVKVSYYPKGYAVPDVKIGRETLKSLLNACGFDYEIVPIADPLTSKVCTWWLCRKPGGNVAQPL